MLSHCPCRGSCQVPCDDDGDDPDGMGFAIELEHGDEEDEDEEQENGQVCAGFVLKMCAAGVVGGWVRG